MSINRQILGGGAWLFFFFFLFVCFVSHVQHSRPEKGGEWYRGLQVEDKGYPFVTFHLHVEEVALAFCLSET